jgi:hypothetical protein
MRTFKSYIKENMLDSDREVNYYNSLAKERMKLLTPKEPTYQNAFIGKTNNQPEYQKAFIGKTNSVRKIEEARTVGNLQIHDPSKYDVLNNKVAPNAIDTQDDHKLMSDHTDSIPHEEAEKSALQKYTGSGYLPINQYLYGTTNEITPQYSSHIDNLMSLLQKSITPKPLTVFSGIKKDPKEYNVENSLIHMQAPAFTSTSLSHRIAQGFSHLFPHVDDEGNQIMDERGYSVFNKNILVLNIPKGAHGYYADTNSYMSGEREFILHPGAKFHLWHKPVKFVDRIVRDTIFNHWHGRLVHDGIREHPIPEDDPWHPKNLGI